jgi:hypothetical protein
MSSEFHAKMQPSENERQDPPLSNQLLMAMTGYLGAAQIQDITCQNNLVNFKRTD